MVHIPTFEMGQRIPKLIYQTFPNKTQLPIELKENIQTICRKNPNWDYCLFDDADIESFILKYYKQEILEIYHTINPAYGPARADFFRYLLLYATGGVYLDIKSSVTQAFNELLAEEDRYILSNWDTPGWGQHKELKPINGGSEYMQWFIITVKGHPFLREVIERVIYNIKHYNILKVGVGKKAVLRLTGPVPYTLAIEKLKAKYPFRIVSNCKDFGLIYSIYSDLQDNKAHEHVFKKHYSSLKAPVVIQTDCKNYCFTGLYCIYLSIKTFIRKFRFYLRDC